MDPGGFPETLEEAEGMVRDIAQRTWQSDQPPNPWPSSYIKALCMIEVGILDDLRGVPPEADEQPLG